MVELKVAFAISVMLVAGAGSAAGQASMDSDSSGSATHTASFDVADLLPSPHVLRPFMDGGNLKGDRYVIHQATMGDLISIAYNVDSTNVQGGPSWLDWDRFEIVAKAPATTSKADLRLMLRPGPIGDLNCGRLCE